MSNTIAARHVWVWRAWNVASVTAKLNSSFQFHSNTHRWLVVTTLGPIYPALSFFLTPTVQPLSKSRGVYLKISHIGLPVLLSASFQLPSFLACKYCPKPLEWSLSSAASSSRTLSPHACYFLWPTDIFFKKLKHFLPIFLISFLVQACLSVK